jgi:hypothetical protein
MPVRIKITKKTRPPRRKLSERSPRKRVSPRTQRKMATRSKPCSRNRIRSQKTGRCKRQLSSARNSRNRKRRSATIKRSCKGSKIRINGRCRLTIASTKRRARSAARRYYQKKK